MREEEKMGPKLPAFDEARQGGFYTIVKKYKYSMSWSRMGKKGEVKEMKTHSCNDRAGDRPRGKVREHWGQGYY